MLLAPDMAITLLCRCAAPSILPALGKGREVTTGQLFIPIHSVYEGAAPDYGFQSLYVQVHWACIPRSSASLSWLSQQDLVPQHPVPLVSKALSASSCLIQNNLETNIYP